MNRTYKKVVKEVKQFVSYTAVDFVNVWNFRPNVLIWCAILGFILYWI